MPKIEHAGGGRVMFSIELELAIDRASLVRQQRMDHLAADLLAYLDEHHVPATWAVADPAHSAASTAILGSGGNHEIAVLADRSWTGPGAGRLRVDRELSRRFEGARRQGMAATTLVLKDVMEPLDPGLLLAHGIQAISYRSEERGKRAFAPASLRFGVWHAPAAWRLPRAPCWWSPVRSQARRLLREAIAQNRTLHVGIDADALVDDAQSGLRQVRAVIQEAARLQTLGRIQFSTLASRAAVELAARAVAPARSLLKPAA